VHREHVIIIIIVVVVVGVEWLNVEDGGRRRAARCAAGVVLASTGVGLGGGGRATPQHELVGQVEPGVVLHRQIVGVVPAPRPTHAVGTAPHRPVDLRSLEQRPGGGVVAGGRARRKLNEEEEFVDDVEMTTTDVTACVVAHVTKYRLNCVPIRVAFNTAKSPVSVSL